MARPRPLSSEKSCQRPAQRRKFGGAPSTLRSLAGERIGTELLGERRPKARRELVQVDTLTCALDRLYERDHPDESIIERSSASLEGGIARASTTISSGRWKPKRKTGRLLSSSSLSSSNSPRSSLGIKWAICIASFAVRSSGCIPFELAEKCDDLSASNKTEGLRERARVIALSDAIVAADGVPMTLHSCAVASNARATPRQFDMSAEVGW